MGFNADEVGRSLRDGAANKNPLRQGVYPLIEWGWGRERCEAFLYDRFGVKWEKSHCMFCCFPVSMGAMDAHLERMRRHPDIAGRVLRLEYTSVSLNPKAKLFGRRSLLEQFDPGRAADRPVLAAFEEEARLPVGAIPRAADPARGEGGPDSARAGDALGGAGRRGPGVRSRPEAAERLGAARRPGRGR